MKYTLSIAIIFVGYMLVSFPTRHASNAISVCEIYHQIRLLVLVVVFVPRM